METLIDTVLQERYQIQSLLSRQKGRRTFLATDLQTQTPVVIKLLLFAPDFTWDDLKLFEREAEVLKFLDRPTIPKYLDYFEVETELGKGFALVQTYIEAKSLQSWIESGRTFGEVELRVIARELLDTLDYLHHRQPSVVHRDIKPSNILLGDRSGNSPGRIYLVDFGSVQTAVNEGTRTIVGTYGYMPPEQFGGQCTPASDLYALGATLIYLATGQSPDRLPQQEMRILFEDRVALSPNLIDCLKWLTEPSIDRRLKSAPEALAALAALAVSNVRASGLAKFFKPAGSKVRVTNTRQMLEIIIPPRGFHLALIFRILFVIVWNSFLLNWYSIAFANWDSGGWFSALFAILHLAVGISMTWQIIFDLLGKVRLRVTQSKIVLESKIFGLICSLPIAADRNYITKIVVGYALNIKNRDGNTVEMPAQVNIWAGTKKITIGGEHSNLTDPEVDWLGQELSNWLDLPIDKNQI